jgi:nucleotide-binding universal stress UspA family protein
MKILVAVDGSKISQKAVKFAIHLAQSLRDKAQLVVLYVEPPLLVAVANRLGAEATAKFHAENGRFALKSAIKALKRAEVDWSEKLLIEEPADGIVRYAAKSKCDLIVLGSHGHGALKGLFLGSVTTKVISRTDIPVTVVR